MTSYRHGHVGVVIRKDGTVPFDDGCHPDVRQAIIAHLVDEGHILEKVPGTQHLKIRNWTPPAVK